MKNNTVPVYGNVSLRLHVDPIDVLKQIRPIPDGDWIVVRKDAKSSKPDKYIHMTEVSAGTHSHDYVVGEVSQEVYEAYIAKETLIKFLEKNATH